MHHITVGILVLLLGLPLAAAADERQNKPATPAEQYQTLVKNFYATANVAFWKAKTDEERDKAVARIDKLTAALLDLVQDNPKDPIALDALVQVVNQEISLENNSSHPGWGKDSPSVKAIAILLRDHIQSDKLGEACRRVQYGFRRECETFLRTVLEKSPHKDVQALACLRLAQFLNGRLQRLDLVKGRPEMAKRYEGLFGKDYLEALQRRDRAEAVKEVEAVFERAAAKYGDIKVPYGGTVAERAQTELFEIRHLAVGKEAPDIEEEDQDGKRFKLSDYRGKVVLLDFWQEF